ncbi:CCA tRNA nucleotidyltransferase [Candidatus Peregrinibacteria bacterium]|nr:MAG: CCA tRNA nucleotidyltransferase [Candidatus Peregrinibacteria bacterium]
MEQAAINIVAQLQKAGFEAYFAGGSVRDMLMERTPGDYDIATSAKPDEIEDVLEKTIPIGKAFGVILAEHHGHHFEVATFRSDSSTSDGRRPDAILFTSAKEDAVRRDFTINGLFYDPIAKKVYDYVDGQHDIQHKLIRFIGEPHERIKEDHLRLLRGIRFKNEFGFDYHPKTEAAIRELAHLVDSLSAERVLSELTKMLLSSRRSHAVKELDDFGLLERILPEITAGKGVNQPAQYHQEGDVFTHLLKSLHDLPNDWANEALVWAILLHDIGKPRTFEQKTDRIHFDGHAEEGARMAQKIADRLKMPKVLRNKMVWLIHQHMSIGTIKEMRQAHRILLFSHPWFEDLMRLHYCDEHGSLPIDLTLYNDVMAEYHQFKDEKLLTELVPLLNGNDLMTAFHLKEGPQFKEILDEVKMLQIEGALTTKQEALDFVANLIKS